MKKPLLILIIPSFLLIVLIFYFAHNIFLSEQAKREGWREHTTPISFETAEYLCQAFEVPLSDPRCSPTEVVYGPDFYPEVTEWVETVGREYDEVQEILGRFLVSCEDRTQLSSGRIYFRCHYDLRGDDVFWIGIYFNDDETVDRISAPLSDF